MDDRHYFCILVWPNKMVLAQYIYLHRLLAEVGKRHGKTLTHVVDWIDSFDWSKWVAITIAY